MGDAGDALLICPGPKCNEEIEREGNGKFPKFCDECGYDFPEYFGQLFQCPMCRIARKKKTKKYARLCGGCKFNFETGTASKTLSRGGAAVDVTKAERQATTPDVQSTSENSTDSHESSAAAGDGKRQLETKPEHVVVEMGGDGGADASNSMRLVDPGHSSVKRPASSSSAVRHKQTGQEQLPPAAAKRQANDGNMERGQSTGAENSGVQQQQFGAESQPQGALTQQRIPTRSTQSGSTTNSHHDQRTQENLSEQTNAQVADRKSKSEAKPTREPTASSAGSAQDAYSQLTELRQNVTELRNAIRANATTFTKDEKDAISKLHKDVENHVTSYENTTAHQLNKGGKDRKKCNTQKKVEDILKDMKNLLSKIPEHALTAMTKMPREKKYGKGTTGTQPSQANRPNCRRIEFWAVLSEGAKEHFAKKSISLEIRTNHGNYDWDKGRSLATLKETANGIWKGECTSISKNTSHLEYKYSIRDVAGKSVMLEKLYHDGNRHLRFSSHSDEGLLTIYDGALLSNEKKGGISGAVRGMVNYFFTGKEKAERLQGFLAMLPDWHDEVRKGRSIENLTEWIKSATSRQQDLLAEFNSGSATNVAKAELQESLQGYLVDQFWRHETLYTDPAIAPGDVCLSMIGLIHAAQPVLIKCSDANLLGSLSSLIENTVTQISPRQQSTYLADASMSFNICLTAANRFADSLNVAMHVLAAAKETYFNWILLIPLYHKLKKMDIAKRGRRDQTEEWWGTKGFDVDVQTLKVICKSDKSAWRVWSDMLRPFFQIDDILPYSFLSLLTVDQFVDFLANITSLPWYNEIPFDGILACGNYHLNKNRSYQSLKKPIYEALHQSLKWLQTLANFEQSLDIQMVFDIATTLLNGSNGADEACSIEINLGILAVCLNVGKDAVKLDLAGIPLIEFADKMRAKKLESYRGFTSSPSVDKFSSRLNYELQRWENQFQCSSGHQLVQDWWMSHCRASFALRVKQINYPGYFVQKILSKSEIKAQQMSEVIQEYLLSIPEWWLQPENARYLTDGQGSAEMWSMVENAVVSSWAVREDEDRFAVALNMVRKKQTFFAIWNFCNELSAKSGNHLSTSSMTIARSVSAYEVVMERIMQATVTLGEFEQLSSLATDAVELCVVSDTLSSRRDDILLAFTRRQAEFDEYGKFVSEFSEFWQCCKLSYRDSGPIDDWLARPFRKLSFEETVNSMAVKVICDLIPDDVRDLLRIYNSYKYHRLFDAMLIPSLSGKATWLEIVAATTESMGKYDKLIATIEDGTIDVSSLKELKKTYFNGNKDDLLNQLPTMIPDERICAERSDQISICVELDEYYKGAEAIIAMRDMFELTGDFSAIEILVQAKEHTLQLKDISRQLVVSADVIRNITAEQIDCLDAFAHCSEFVMWVRDEVQKNDIAVFVDLASSTLGEDDLATQKTRYLLNTLTGYTPLLYDFNPEKADFGSFLDLCKKVWHNMESNPDLPNNLRLSASQTELFKKVKTHFGSTEITTVSQAAAINSTGLYEIGNITGYSKEFKTLDNVVRLTCVIPEKTEDGETEDKEKTYTYTDLKDLQSRLALVAGDKQKESADTIQHFDEMRDAVENLGNAYIEIKREGCIQFDDMMVVVHCNTSHAAGVEIRLQSIGKTMMGRTAEKTALEHCQNVYGYLNSCLKKWRESMDIQRSNNAELNFYTTEQLVVLRKQLGQFVCEKDVSQLQKAIPLLSMIHVVDPTELLDIVTKYDEGDGDEEDIQDARPTYEMMESHQQDIVDYLTDEYDEFSREMAVEVYNVLGDDASDIEKAMEWYEEWKREQNEKEGAGETSDDVLSKLIKESEGQRTLQQRLDKLWDEFIDHTSKSIKNFLGIPHLSYVLRQLKEQSGIPEQSRRLPSWLDRGKPVLIGVPQDQTYQMVLTIYEADKRFLKPTRNEVLLCTKRTRKDEVALFLNRALNDPLSFYCMVNCHLIKYEVCRTIENRLNNLADQKVKDYGLAFLYAEESKNARIKAYLDRYLARNSQVTESAKLMDYVRAILHVVEEAEAACCVDPNRSLARLIRSSRAGVGKSLQAKSLVTDLRRNHGLPGKDITIALHKTVDMDSVIARLTEEFADGNEEDSYDTIHLDIAHEVESGVDELLFNMIVLRSLVNSDGIVWQANQRQYCIIECMPFTRENGTSAHEVLDFLPATVCVTPTEAYRLYQNPPEEEFIGFNKSILEDEHWQLVLKHLLCFAKKELTYNITNMADIDDAQKAVKLLIKNCGLRDPTWSELRHYVHFLSSQLAKVISSPFCGPVFANELPGFKPFVIDFMFKMAKDFATRSLRIAEETPGRNLQEVTMGETDDLFSNLSMKKTWEQSNYPYLFFNEDGESFTTLGFDAKRWSSGLYSKHTDETFFNYTMPEGLYNALVQNELPVKEDFNKLSRQQWLQKLRGIMVKTDYHERVPNPNPKPDDDNTVLVKKPMFAVDDDPDPNYVLTMDNAKKIIAIHQRLRVNIPVIIMGETGCGKTKLIDFMGKLQVPTELKGKLQTMVIVKIHGGTTEEEIVGKICSAQKLAEQNQQEAQDFAKRHNSEQVPTVYTILFLDEVNTTEAIGLVKEIICDNRMNGVPLPCDSRLKIVAACNPYRRHSDAMIEKLKTAGLGYNVGEDETTDKFCKIPMRHLVYRVQALSQSLLPLVWDFGTLQSKPSTSSAGSDVTTSVEGAYIKQMIIKFDESSGPDGIHFELHTEMIAELLSMSQNFMRQQKDECSFVSLRDIQRLLEVSNWFYTQRKHFFPVMDARKMSRHIVLLDANQPAIEYHRPDDVVRSVLLAVGICYLARLETDTRVLYTGHINEKIGELMAGSQIDGGECLIEQVNLCQDMLIDVVVDSKQHKNIAKNKALKENVFMMIVCIENRIPLFVIGKPGSSKSLSKSMVFDSMKGDLSRNPLFKEMKNTYMVSFQCSRHATPSGIVGVFRHCAVYQKEQDLNKFVSVVVLDEVGLAEDSENMPLKALHPLLEDGCVGSEEPEPYKKCAFIGISNWALDPAKMNRGIFIQIGSPANNELEHIAREICRSSMEQCDVGKLIGPLSRAYLKICQAQKPEGRDLTEFFGLRDFYSLMKMVVNFARVTGRVTRQQLEHSIKRNFGGFDPDQFSPMDIFIENCPTIQTLPIDDEKGPSTNSIGLIKSSLFTPIDGMDSRYLLILTENLSVLSVILDEFSKHDSQPEVVFGSRFSDDLSYTQVCHNLYRIKMCMDMGRPVILLNLDDLYESLYDALNQYFSVWGDKKFVDLGLGTHRVKAYVKDSFRLVLIADKNKVHSQFPIPLINRLEKHYVSATSLLSKDQKEVKESLKQWMDEFVKPSKQLGKSCPTCCDGCGSILSQPYRMPCSKQHYIGECCREEIFQKQTKECPGRSCTGGDIDENYKWIIDKSALESRQYFENSSVSSSFIGYSSETTALVVKKATDDVWDTRTQYDQMWPQVFEHSKTYLLQCATAESILRLDRTVLQKEAASLQKIYMADQRHENLLQYLEHELSRVEHESLQIQVTSFAEIMSSGDINSLSQHLNLQGDTIVIESLYLKDYPKESLFTDAVRKFYEKSVDKIKLLIIQCESANENVELLDSVRYIVQREMAALPKEVNHTVLLLSLARGHTFSGYQGGKWKCVHIDDPRSPVFKLPSLRKCMEMKPCELLAGVLKSQNNPEVANTALENCLPPHVDDEIEDNDEPPPLAHIDEDDDGYIDTELTYGESHAEAQIRSDSTHADSGDIVVEDVLLFIEHCLPRAVSVIKCDQSYDRVAELKSLFRGNSDFQITFLTHVYNLLLEQDKYSSADWVRSDAAKASNMKKSETLRHALEDSLERSFRPAIAAVIAFIDPYNNLKLFNSEPSLAGLWTNLFTKCEDLGLNYEQLTKVAVDKIPTSRLPKSYVVRQVCAFTNHFPFSWIVKDVLDQLMEVQTNTVLNKGRYLLGDWLIKPFSAMVIGEIIMSDAYGNQTQAMVAAYIHDFVHMTHSCGSDTEHWIVEQALQKCLTDRYHGKALIPHVHITYKDIQHEMKNMGSLLKINFTGKDLATLVKQRIEEMMVEEEESVKMVEKVEPSNELSAGDASSDVDDEQAAEADEPTNDIVTEEQETDAKERADDAVNAMEYCDVQMAFADEEAGSLVADVSDEAILPELEEIDQKIRFDVIALQLLIGELFGVSLQILQKETQHWIDQVDQCKLLMEKILDGGIGDYNDPIVVSCRSSWSELELKKLYVEHVILPGEVDAVTGKRKPHKIMGFIKAVKEKVFHRKQGFEQVVASVTKLVKDGIRGLYKNCPPQCPVCLNVLGSPAKLPCGHLICDSCVGEIRICPQEGCGEEVPQGYMYNPTEDDIDKKKLREFEELRNGLNRFFMHFVSELVFSAGVVPEMDIIKWLTTCVTFRDMTKKFSFFNGDDIIDPTPVLRSFLLKLLLQCQDNPAVEDYLDETIGEWGGKNPLDQLPKMVMLMNCHKDLSAIIQQSNLQDLERNLVRCADSYPETNQHQQTPSILALTSIADMHTLISKSVEYIWLETTGKELLVAMKKLLETTRLNGNSQPGYFVVRQLIACAGEGYVKDLINTARNFLVPDNVQEVLAAFTVPDVLSAFGGEAYCNVRSLVSVVIAASGTEEDIEDAIGELLEVCREDEALLLHTLFTRITRTMSENVPVSLAVRQQLRNRIAKAMPQRHHIAMMLELLLEDDAMPLEMNVTQSKGVSLSMLVLHLFTSISQCEERDDLYPFTELITQPAQAAKHYLPTMTDDASEIAQIAYKEAFLTKKDTEQFKPYLCPNGHVYFIAGCGNPVHTTIKCFCGAQIGGDMRNKLYANNKAVTEETMNAIRSKRGHILGHAVKRSLTSQAERELSPLSGAVIRCLLHLAMYTSSLFHPNELLTVIEPALSGVEELGQFLEAHIQIDLQQISQCCEESTDSCILLLHDVINRLGQASDAYETLDICVLESIEDRRVWENKFEIKYIQPTFHRKTDCLNQIKSRLNTGAPRDLADILSTEKNPINEENFLASAGLWGYARPLTLTSVQNLINADGKDYPLLEAMVTNCDRLIAVKSLPDIFYLIKMLCDKFHSQLRREQADIDVDRFIAYHYTKFNLPENRLRPMIRSYVKAWNIAITCNDFAIADAEPLSDNPPLSEFLIDKHQRQASHPLQLIRFLIETHNRLISVVDQHRPSLSIGEVTISMLVSVASRDEVITLISSHREYHLHTNPQTQDDTETAERVATFDGTIADEERQVNPSSAVQLHQDNLQAAQSTATSDNIVLIAEQKALPLPAAQPAHQETLLAAESAATSNEIVLVVEQQALPLPTAQPHQEILQVTESAATSGDIALVVERQGVPPLTAQHHQDNLQAAEREATLRYIGTRCKIKYIQDDIPCYMYQEDFSLWNQMEALAESQERLDDEAQRSITGSVSTTIQSLTTHLKNLSIVINYLSVMPQYDTDSSLMGFMERTVGTEPAYLKPTVMIKHVLHVWLLLKYTQTDALMYNSQKPFDDIEAQYTQELPAGAQATINDICTFNSPRTKILLQELFEYIILRLNKEAIAQQFVEPDMRLHDALRDFVVRQNIHDPNRHDFIVEQLPVLPDDLTVKHAAETWSCVWKRFTTVIRD